MNNSWKMVTLEEVCKFQDRRGVTPEKLGSRFVSDGFRVISAKNIKGHKIDINIGEKRFVDETTYRKWMRSPLMVDDVLLTSEAPLGETAYVTEKLLWCLGQRLFGITTDKTKLYGKFLFYALQTSPVRDDLLSRATGATAQGIRQAELRRVELPLPPLTEQRRIVGILDEAFDGIATARANAETNLQNSRALFESHLQAVFARRGNGWVDRQLATLCYEITVGHVGPMKSQYKGGGVPFLRSQNIRPFEISMENAMFIDETFHRVLKKSQLRPGDLAIVRTGYPGTAAVIPPELPDANCSDLVIVRPSKEVSPHFLAAFFNSAFGKQLVLGKIVGAAQKHFNITAAKEVMLHVPPISEQRAIIAKSDELREKTRRLESLYRLKLSALDALKKSLLHRAFTGQL